MAADLVQYPMVTLASNETFQTPNHLPSQAGNHSATDGHAMNRMMHRASNASLNQEAIVINAGVAGFTPLWANEVPFRVEYPLGRGVMAPQNLTMQSMLARGRLQITLPALSGIRNTPTATNTRAISHWAPYPQARILSELEVTLYRGDDHPPIVLASFNNKDNLLGGNVAMAFLAREQGQPGNFNGPVESDEFAHKEHTLVIDLKLPKYVLSGTESLVITGRFAAIKSYCYSFEGDLRSVGAFQVADSSERSADHLGGFVLRSISGPGDVSSAAPIVLRPLPTLPSPLTGLDIGVRLLVDVLRTPAVSLIPSSGAFQQPHRLLKVTATPTDSTQSSLTVKLNGTDNSVTSRVHVFAHHALCSARDYAMHPFASGCGIKLISGNATADLSVPYVGNFSAFSGVCNPLSPYSNEKAPIVFSIDDTNSPEYKYGCGLANSNVLLQGCTYGAKFHTIRSVSLGMSTAGVARQNVVAARADADGCFNYHTVELGPSEGTGPSSNGDYALTVDFDPRAQRDTTSRIVAYVNDGQDFVATPRLLPLHPGAGVDDSSALFFHATTAPDPRSLVQAVVVYTIEEIWVRYVQQLAGDLSGELCIAAANVPFEQIQRSKLGTM